jgi:CRISPR-associated protein Csm4
MKTLKFTLQPLSPFGTPLAGDSLFGHICWAIRERRGESDLTGLLKDYTAGHPFLVMSDGFPQGFVPRPAAPDFVFGLAHDPAQRKKARGLRWLPAEGAGQPIHLWMGRLADADAGIVKTFVVTQNTINRLTGTTGKGQFAPRQADRTSFAKDAQIDVYATLDEKRISAEELAQLLNDIGLTGYGRDATAGLGKFEVSAWNAHTWPAASSCHWLTLAPCAPDPAALDAEGCFYLPVTRFGRHGNLAVTSGKPFKSPVLMAATGALLKSTEEVRWAFHGRGLGGRDNPLSKVIPDTVHQGYAPVVPLTMTAQ